MGKLNKMEILENGITKDEIQGIIVLIIIFMVGWFSILSGTWWVKLIGWTVLALVGITAYNIGRMMKLKQEERNLEIKKRRDNLKLKKEDING